MGMGMGFLPPCTRLHGCEQPEGDRVELYRTELFYEEGEH